MKKTILTIVLCGILLIGMTGCGTIKNEFKVGEKSNIEVSQTDVLMSIKEGTLKNTGATLVLTNNSDKNYSYGNPYTIEIKKDDIWHKIDVKLNFTLPAFSLKSKEVKEIDLNWENGYGKLASGSYRIIKDINYEIEEGNYETFNIAAEFTID